MMSLFLQGLLAAFALCATGVLQLRAFRQGKILDVTALITGSIGLGLTAVLVISGLNENGGRPTTGLMGSMLGALLLMIVLGSSLRHPVNSLLIGVAPLTGVFAVITALVTPSNSNVPPLNIEAVSHVAASIVAYGSVAYAGTLAVLLSWQNAKLKERPLKPLIAAMPPIDAMSYLFLRTVQAAWLMLTISLITGVAYIEDFWAQHLAHKTVLSVFAWFGMGLALWQHFQQGGVTQTMRKTSIAAAVMLFIGYIGSKAIMEFIL